jgi:branched-chain amino acid transport system ATP-binding protein
MAEQSPGSSVMAVAVSPEGLVLRGVGVRFGGLTALEDVSLAVPPAGVVGVIGPNGAGKTTLFNVVCGFVPARTGDLLWRGAPLRPRPHRLARLGIARTLQGVGLFAGLTVLENVMVAAGWGYSPPRHDEGSLRRAALSCLDELGLAGRANRYPASLPYPVRKRIALARALVSRPRLLLLDEPAAGLGADDIEELAALVRALPGRGDGCAVMLVEHHMDLVMRVCEEVVVLDFGRVIATGPPERIRDDPAVIDAYLGVSA